MIFSKITSLHESSESATKQAMKKDKAAIPVLTGDVFFIDSHCHLDMDSYEEDLEAVLERARHHGVQSIITIGIDEKSSRRAVELAKTYPMLRATVGIHPHDVNDIHSSTWQNLERLIEDNREYIVAYGEIGLDYARNYSEPETQKKAFRKQLQLAKDLQLPVIIHDRDAHEDTIAILQELGPFPKRGVMHCFSGDIKLAEKVIDLGFLISIPGVVTFKNGQTLQEVVKASPLESLILETDGPFLAPVPWRGKRNEPAYLLYAAEKVAELKDVSMEELARQTSKNAGQLFNYSVST